MENESKKITISKWRLLLFVIFFPFVLIYYFCKLLVSLSAKMKTDRTSKLAVARNTTIAVLFSPFLALYAMFNSLLTKTKKKETAAPEEGMEVEMKGTKLE